MNRDEERIFVLTNTHTKEIKNTAQENPKSKAGMSKRNSWSRLKQRTYWDLKVRVQFFIRTREEQTRTNRNRRPWSGINDKTSQITTGLKRNRRHSKHVELDALVRWETKKVVDKYYFMDIIKGNFYSQRKQMEHKIKGAVLRVFQPYRTIL